MVFSIFGSTQPQSPNAAAAVVQAPPAGIATNLIARLAPFSASIGTFIGNHGGNALWNHGLGRSCNALAWVATHTTTHKIAGLTASFAAGGAVVAGLNKAAEEWTINDFYDVASALSAGSKLGIDLRNSTQVEEAAAKISKGEEALRYIEENSMLDPKTTAVMSIEEQMKYLNSEQYLEAAKAAAATRELLQRAQNDLGHCMNNLAGTTDTAFKSKDETISVSRESIEEMRRSSAETNELLERYADLKGEFTRCQTERSHVQQGLDQCRADTKKRWF